MRYGPILFFALFAGPSVFASPTSRPSADPTIPVLTIKSSNTLRITEVTGHAQVRESEDCPWTKIDVPREIPRTAEIRTGPRSTVKIEDRDGNNVVFDKIGTCKLSEQLSDEGEPLRLKHDAAPTGKILTVRSGDRWDGRFWFHYQTVRYTLDQETPAK